MISKSPTPLLNRLYQQYLLEQDVNRFARSVLQHYTAGSLERLLAVGGRMTRRAAALALGIVGDYRSNASLGRALADDDRGVRMLADTGIRSLWCRVSNCDHRRRLGILARLNGAHRCEEALLRATELINDAPWLAEAWNQRAIAHFELGRFIESVRDCQQALELNPYHFLAAAGMAQCHLKLSSPRAALDCFSRALRLNPSLEGIRGQVIRLQRVLKNQE